MANGGWTCPICSTRVPLFVESVTTGATVTVTVPEAVLADVWSHMWTEHEALADDWATRLRANPA